MREAGVRETQVRDPAAPDAVGEAARRLDRALGRLEALVGARAPDADLFDHDRAALAAELDAALARERALEAAAAAASAALGRAADEVRLALGPEAEDAPDGGADIEPWGSDGDAAGPPPPSEDPS